MCFLGCTWDEEPYTYKFRSNLEDSIVAMNKFVLGITAGVLLISGCARVEHTPVSTAPDAAQAAAHPDPVAYGRFVPEREDDFAWENDKVAFRVYGPGTSGDGPNSGVDAWLKRVNYPIIDKWYEEDLQGQSYYEDHGEGYDPYHTGTSRGVGGTAIWIDGVPFPASSFRSYEIHSNRGDEVKFSLEYSWETPIGSINENKTVSLRLGDQLYRVNSIFTLDGEPAELPIAIGLTTHNGTATSYSNDEKGRISTWEFIDSHGLGTGVLIDAERVREIVRVDSDVEDQSHIWLVTSTDESGRLSFRAGFAWELAGEIESFEQWNHYLDSRADRFSRHKK